MNEVAAIIFKEKRKKRIRRRDDCNERFLQCTLNSETTVKLRNNN